MDVKEVLKKYEEDNTKFLKNRKAYSSTFPFEFADYMVKYADADVLKKWEEEAGIRDKNKIMGRFTKPIYSDEPDNKNWCVANKDKIISHIDEEIKALSDCPQETCPLSNLERGKYEALKKLKEYIEGLEW